MIDGEDNNNQLKLIRAKLSKSNYPLRTDLTADEQRRVKKLERLFAKLKAGKHVQNRDLQTWLTAEEYAEIEAGWDVEQQLRQMANVVPDSVKEYEQLLKKASFTWAKMKGLRRQGHLKSAGKMEDQAVSELEDALEHLQDLLDQHTDYAVWFDRPIDFSVDGDLYTDPAAMPRLITSRSCNSRNSTSSKRTIRDIKLEVVERALYNLTTHPCLKDDSEQINQNNERLQALISSPSTDPFDDL